MIRPQSTLVVGAGVSGLTCAVRLLESGRAVRIVAAAPPEATTSMVAAALWYPYQTGPPEEVLGWCARSLEVFGELAREGAATGVRMVEGIEVVAATTRFPDWATVVPGFRAAHPRELPVGFDRGFHFRVPVMEMPRYLAWLRARVEALGGRFEWRELGSVDEALDEADVVVNCTGLGARELAADGEVYAIRGQVLRVDCRAARRILLDERGAPDVAYVVPRSSDVVLGGSASRGREDLRADPVESAAILERCAALEPALEGARTLSVAVGLRPGRDRVRLEVEQREGGKVLAHDYGHGGAGVTLSWGCADELVRLLNASRSAEPSEVLGR